MGIIKPEQLAGMNIHYRYYTIDDFFSSMQRLGYQSVEIWTCPQHFYMDSHETQNAVLLKKKAAGYGLHIVCLTPEQNNPKPHNIAAKDPELKKKTFQYFLNAVRAAGELECGKVLVTSGWSFYSEDREEAWKRSVDMLGRLCPVAAENGVVLAMEALQPYESRLVTDIPSMKKMLDDVDSPSLKITADLGAIARAGETVGEYFKAFGGNIVHSHFVDGRPGSSHMAWGDGERDLNQCLTAFASNHYQGYFTLEYANSDYYENPFEADRKTIQLMKDYIQ